MLKRFIETRVAAEVERRAGYTDLIIAGLRSQVEGASESVHQTTALEIAARIWAGAPGRRDREGHGPAHAGDHGDDRAADRARRRGDVRDRGRRRPAGAVSRFVLGGPGGLAIPCGAGEAGRAVPDPQRIPGCCPVRTVRRGPDRAMEGRGTADRGRPGGPAGRERRGRRYETPLRRRSPC